MNKKQFIERMVEHTDSPKGESRNTWKLSRRA